MPVALAASSVVGGGGLVLKTGLADNTALRALEGVDIWDALLGGVFAAV